MQSDGPRALTVRDIQQRSRCGKTAIFAELKAGRLRSFKIGKRRLVLEDDFCSWLAAHGAAIDAPVVCVRVP